MFIQPFIGPSYLFVPPDIRGHIVYKIIYKLIIIVHLDCINALWYSHIPDFNFPASMVTDRC